MCGHGLIGLVRTLEFLGRLGQGALRIDTPVGTVGAELEADGAVTIENVPSYCHARDVALDVPDLGRVTGDVAWGGNWFFLTELRGAGARARERRRCSPSSPRGSSHALARAGRDGPRRRGDRPRRALRPAAARGRRLAQLRALPRPRLRPLALRHRAPPRSSPCSPRAASSAPGQRWRQESITGSRFEGWLEERDGALVPRIRGRAYVTGPRHAPLRRARPLPRGLHGRPLRRSPA